MKWTEKDTINLLFVIAVSMLTTILVAKSML